MATHTKRRKQAQKASKPKSKLHLGTAILLLAIGIVISVGIFVAFNFATTSVVVATQTIPGNTEITADMVTTKNIGNGSLPDHYISAGNLSNIVGSYTDVGVTKGSVFTTGNVASSKSRKSAAIKSGYTRMTVSSSNIPSGIQTDDHVNILISISLSDYGKSVLTYQNVLVTNVTSASSGSISALEIEVTPEQAQQIQYAENNGNLTITLLPSDYEEENLDVTDEDSISNFSSESNSSKSKVTIDNSK